jgi:hypothetical protein
MEQFYRFDRDYNFNYVKHFYKIKEEINYDSNVNSDVLVNNFLKKKKEESTNK